MSRIRVPRKPQGMMLKPRSAFERHFISDDVVSM